jgi:hypothetical protein
MPLDHRQQLKVSHTQLASQGSPGEPSTHVLSKPVIHNTTQQSNSHGKTGKSTLVAKKAFSRSFYPEGVGSFTGRHHKQGVIVLLVRITKNKVRFCQRWGSHLGQPCSRTPLCGLVSRAPDPPSASQPQALPETQYLRPPSLFQ